MAYARPPPELSSKGSMDVNWKDWRQQFLIFLKASGTIDAPKDVKSSLLMNLIGPVGHRAAKDFEFDSPDDIEDMDILIEKFNKHFAPDVTEAHERYIFFSSAKQNTESIDQYVKTLKTRAETCNFGELSNTLIRDKIVLDVKNTELRKHLLVVPNLNLNQTIDLWKKFETAEKLTQLCLPKMGQDKIAKERAKSLSGHSDSGTAKCASMCGRCGAHEKHNDLKDCPAYREKCENCGMLNHLTILCTKPAAAVNNTARNESKTPKHFNPGPFTQIPQSNTKKDFD